MLNYINKLMALLNLRGSYFFRPLFNILTRPESATIIGLMLSVLLFYETQKFQKQHDFYLSIIKEHIDSDIKLLEVTGALISLDKYDKKNAEKIQDLKRQFEAIYYGRTLFFEGCLFKGSNRLDALWDLKRAIKDYYSDENWDISLDSVKERTYILALEVSKSYKDKEKGNECLF